MQALFSRFRDHVDPDVAHVADASEMLSIGEFELFRLAYRCWYDRPCEETILDRAFGEYLTGARVPPWVRHYCRRVLVLAAVDQLDPRDFGVERPRVRRLCAAEQRFASLMTLLVLLVYWLVFA